MSTLITPPEVSAPPQPESADALLPKRLARSRPLFDPEIVGRAVRASFVKLNPAAMRRNPVMFVVEVGAAFTTILLVRDILVRAGGIGFTLQIAVWLWFTVLF